jgi:hypothetical protein
MEYDERVRHLELMTEIGRSAPMVQSNPVQDLDPTDGEKPGMTERGKELIRPTPIKLIRGKPTKLF